MSFDHIKIEERWQKKWQEEACFEAQVDWNKKKYYALDMFPYPSGAGLHVGHLASYTPTDIVSRFKRAQGFNVLHPIGYDAFGLPAEQYAIQTGIHPLETTKKAITNFKRQLKSFGFSFDWSREISTCDPSYYKWTQQIFIYLFKKNLAYKKMVPVNWCPALRTILANEEVVDGKSERGGHPVFKKNIEQWVLKITDYVEPLLQDLDQMDWPDRTKEGQKHWIGKSEGTQIAFSIEKTNNASFLVFTTRPDTLFGCTFVVLSPEHPLIEKEFKNNKEFPAVLEYIKKCQSKSDLDKKKDSASSGVFSGSFAIHPITQKRLPIWIADYVLMDYGTGAIMAVPAHDERDFNFANTFDIDIQPVIENDSLPFEGDGPHIHSDFINGLHKQEAIHKMNQYLIEKKIGVTQVQYKLRDWIFSRQRYWGEPFPIAYLPSGTKTLEEDLPVILPETAHYEPSEQGEPPLARVKDFVIYKDKKTKEEGRRETDTMPGSAASSWYFLRYTDPHNEQAPFSFDAQKYWMPVDLYVGGAEHTVGHLLYSRFWNKVLYDMGLVSHKEPFKKLVHQGSILGSDGQRMSKSRGNTVSPDEVREKYGADTARLYISFLGPFDKDKPWSDGGIEGCRRFLERFWRLCVDENNQSLADEIPISKDLNKLIHQTCRKVTEDIENICFNTAISSLMILLNKAISSKCKNKEFIKVFCRLLQPFAPHISEEIWSLIGEKDLVSLAPWPSYDKNLIQEEKITIAVQVNGKTRETISLSVDCLEEQALEQAQQLPKIQTQLENKTVFKVIYKKGKILNILCK